MCIRRTQIFKDPNFVKNLAYLHDKFSVNIVLYAQHITYTVW